MIRRAVLEPKYSKSALPSFARAACSYIASFGSAFWQRAPVSFSPRWNFANFEAEEPILVSNDISWVSIAHPRSFSENGVTMREL